MPTLDATIGGVSANSYIDVADATTYFDERLNVTAWTDATADDKARALISATRWADTFDFRGYRTEEAQALQWPRTEARDPDNPSDWDFEQDELPTDLRHAVCEIALEMLNAGTTDLWRVESTIGIKSKQVDVIKTEYFESGQRPVGMERIQQAYRLLAKLLRGGGLTVVRS